MKTLTRVEEQTLIAIVALSERAYLVNIREQMKDITGKYMDVGSINKPLKRLNLQGYLDVVYGDPTPVRGGKSKKFYRLTGAGYRVLEEVKAIHDRMWNKINIPEGNV